jgi:hypothetical protein
VKITEGNMQRPNWNDKLTDECHESRQTAQKLFYTPQINHNPKKRPVTLVQVERLDRIVIV